MKSAWKWTTPQKLITSPPLHVRYSTQGSSSSSTLQNLSQNSSIPQSKHLQHNKHPLKNCASNWLDRKSHHDTINFERHYSHAALQLPPENYYTLNESTAEEQAQDSCIQPLRPNPRSKPLTLGKPAFFDRAGAPHLNMAHREASDALWSDQSTSGLLRDLTEAISQCHFELAMQSFDRLSSRRKSRLPTRIYNSLFNLAASVEDLIPKDLYKHHEDAQPLDHTQTHASLNYNAAEGRLSKIECLFLLAGRRFSDHQLIRQLEISVHAAAQRMRELETNSDDDITLPDSEFQQALIRSQDRISEIICRLPNLDDVTNTTAEDLADVVPFPVLGVYARFLTIFHQPGQPLKMMRKVYYAYLIGRRRYAESAERPKRLCNHTYFPDEAGIETGGLIMSVLRHKIHHRMSALKLAVRMITKSDLYPNKHYVFRLLKRMMMSKAEWQSVLHLHADLEHPAAASWLYQQIALVEAEGGRAQRACQLADQELCTTFKHFDNLESHLSLDLAVFTHAIEAIVDRQLAWPHSDNLGLDLQGAIKMRQKMLERGLVPNPESDDIILRAVYQIAKGIRYPQGRKRFLHNVLNSLFPQEKMVRMLCRTTGEQFAAHPGKSVEAFRLMRWLLRWHELDLALLVFQSMSRYGYITSLGALPTQDLKDLLDRALASHPELGAELYHHLSMSGYDHTGIFFNAFMTKAIQMADSSLVVYLLKMKEESSGRKTTSHRITKMVTQFARRRPTPGNVERTLKLFRLIWRQWKGDIGVEVFVQILKQLRRMDPVKLKTRLELNPLLESTVACLSHSGLHPQEAGEIKARFSDYMATASSTATVIDSDRDNTLINDSTRISEQDCLVTASSFDEPKENPKFDTLVDLLCHQIRQEDTDAALDTLKKAIELDLLIPAPHVGLLLKLLVDQKAFEKAEDFNKSWRGMSWKFKKSERGDDRLVIEAMDLIDRKRSWSQLGHDM